MRRSLATSIGRSACALTALLVAATALVQAGACTTFSGLSAGEAGGGGESSGSGGSGGEAPDDPTFLSIEEGARACALAMDCPLLPASMTVSSSVPVDPLNFSLCMTWLAGPIPPGRVGLSVQRAMLRCVATSPTCVEAGACLSLENISADDPRCALGGGGGGGDGGGAVAPPDVFCSADGASVVHCDSYYVIHCDVPYFAAGTTCREGQDGSTWCSSASDCSVADSCTGTVLEYCGTQTGLTFGINCAAIGNTCGLDPAKGYYDCLTAGKIRKCTGTGAVCAGDVVEVCDNDTTSLFDCAELGAACNGEQGLARCARPTDACSPFDDDVNVCDGSTLALCVGGERVSFDCASIGKACLPISGAVLARCG